MAVGQVPGPKAEALPAGEAAPEMAEWVDHLQALAGLNVRIREAAQMGFTRVVMPASNVDPTDLSDGDASCELVGVRTLGEALDALIA